MQVIATTGATLTSTISELTQFFNLPENRNALLEINRGIERETLRIQSDGKLSVQGHNKALGSALTNELITTDYSESLLEFITPVSNDIDETLAQLKDIQKYTLDNANGDYFWPMSMPCIVENEDDIKIAQYGRSNVGKMKTVYRQGLKNRYGSLMQVIAGIHFNFSFSTSFFEKLQQTLGDTQPLQDFQSEKYFSLIRNYKCYGWLIPYLFGSSPAICPTFLQGKPQQLPFKKMPSGCLYLEYATSLRMSDLGYTNSSQSSLQICYNDLGNYVQSVEKAISLPSEEFSNIGVKVDGVYQQLNANVLQIENELYAPIRPKRVMKSGQKPSEALKSGGVEYVEVRAMDINPFVSTGISKEQMHFLDVFLTFCILKDSPRVTADLYQQYANNTNDVIMSGRDPELKLNVFGTLKSIPEWGGEIFADLQELAVLLDTVHNTTDYSSAVSTELAKVHDVDKTPSARIIRELMESDKGIVAWSLDYVAQYNAELANHQYQAFDLAYLSNMAVSSLSQQKTIEETDTKTFDQYLDEYFSN